MVSALDFRSGGRWFEPSPSAVVLLPYTRNFISHCLSSPQVNEWVPVIIMLEGNLAMD